MTSHAYPWFQAPPAWQQTATERPLELPQVPASKPLRVLCWSDVQYPFMDKQADKVLDSFIQEFKPDVAILNGDGLDAYSVGKYTPNPERAERLSDDIAGWRAYLERKTAALGPACIKHYNGGNHEDRIRRYVADKAPQLAGLPGLTIPDLMGLGTSQAGNRTPWTYTPYWNPMADGGVPGYSLHGVLFTHGVRVAKWSGMTAKLHWEKFGGSGVIGHTHRLGEFYHRNYRGEHQDKWIEGGCMCSLQPEYDSFPDWQHGFTAGYMYQPADPEQADKKTWRYDLRPVPIVDGECIWEGRRIQP